MATEISTRTGAVTAAAISEARDLCERSLVTPHLTSRQAVALRSRVEHLSAPATERWVRGRVLTLMSHYFIADRADELEVAIADDWIAGLMGDPCPPAWAINAACVAWISGKSARRRPMPGDIRDLAFEQMPWLISARLRLRIHEDPERWAFTEMSNRLKLLAPDPEPSEASRARVAALLSDIVRNLGAKAGI